MLYSCQFAVRVAHAVTHVSTSHMMSILGVNRPRVTTADHAGVSLLEDTAALC